MSSMITVRRTICSNEASGRMNELRKRNTEFTSEKSKFDELSRTTRNGSVRHPSSDNTLFRVNPRYSKYSSRFVKKKARENREGRRIAATGSKGYRERQKRSKGRRTHHPPQNGNFYGFTSLEISHVREAKPLSERSRAGALGDGSTHRRG